MAITKSAGRTRLRNRLKDTVTSYEHSDSLVDTYLAPALKEIATAIAVVDPDYYLSNRTYRAYSDAVDPGDSGTQSYEFYLLPSDFAAFRWCERFDSSVVQYRFGEASARDQEAYRYGGVNSGFSRVTVRNAGSTDSYDLSPAVGRESISIHGTKFRIVPPPTASGATWRFWYDRYPVDPQGESEPLDIPADFEEALMRAWAAPILADSGDPTLAAVHEKALAKEIAKGQAAHRRRKARSLQVGPVW